MLLVVPTGHHVGLTATSLGLVRALDREGIAVGFAKPIAQPHGSGDDHSSELVRLTTRLEPPASITVERAELLLGDGRLDELTEEVLAIVEAVSGCDVVVVEGHAPSAAHVWSTRVYAAMAQALYADVLLVADGGPGADAADDSGDRLADAVAIAAAPYRTGERLRIAGCVVNRLAHPSPVAVSRLAAALRRHDIALAGAVPFRPEVTWPRIADVVRELGARTLVAGDDSRRVSDVVVCAQAGACYWSPVTGPRWSWPAPPHARGGVPAPPRRVRATRRRPDRAAGGG